MSDPASILIGFALTKLEGEPPAKRAVIYRAIAALAATPAEAADFNSLAADCEAIHSAHEQCVFDFLRRGAKPKDGNGGVPPPPTGGVN